jgi:dephospho-CoA kinase
MMPKTKIVGLTGGIATGKSTVSNILKKARYPVICADKIAHQVVKPGNLAYQKIIKIFGKEVLLKNKTLHRSKIAKIVFTNPEMRRKLENAIHPEVRKEMHRQITSYKKQGKEIIFLDVPLLFEVGLNKICDRTLCVAATQNQQIQRLKKYRKMARAEALTRIRSQMPLKQKIRKADFLIWNTGDKTLLRKKTAAWLETLKKFYEKNSQK